MAEPSRPSTRIPTREDFAPLAREGKVHFQLHFPSPPESTVAILILLHGLGDSETPFAGFARATDLPGVLAISVRGVNPLAPSMVGEPDADAAARAGYFHWGDDLRLGADGELDEDPGFGSAQDAVLERLVRGVLVDRCGWSTDDVLLLGYGQGGSLALGLASRLRGEGATAKFKGVVSIGGPLPRSMVPTVSSRPKAATPALLCRAKRSEGLDADAVEFVKEEFDKVEVAVWENKVRDGMPANRDEMLPIMRFFAERLRDQGGFGS